MSLMRPFMAVLAFLSAPTDAWASRPVSVAEVKSNIRTLDGKSVQIRGWIVGCDGGFDCRLVGSLDDTDGPALTIAFVASFEPRLTLVAGDEVILKATVTDECTVNICLDRGPDIVPIRLMKVF